MCGDALGTPKAHLLTLYSSKQTYQSIEIGSDARALAIDFASKGRLLGRLQGVTILSLITLPSIS